MSTNVETPSEAHSAARAARRALDVIDDRLVIIAVLSMDALSPALDASLSAATGLAVAAAAVILAVSTFLASRILIVVGRHAVGEKPPRLTEPRP